MKNEKMNDKKDYDLKDVNEKKNYYQNKKSDENAKTHGRYENTDNVSDASVAGKGKAESMKADYDRTKGSGPKADYGKTEISEKMPVSKIPGTKKTENMADAIFPKAEDMKTGSVRLENSGGISEESSPHKDKTDGSKAEDIAAKKSRMYEEQPNHETVKSTA